MSSSRPLFGSKSSVENVRDSFGATIEAVKTSESERLDPFKENAQLPPDETPVGGAQAQDMTASQERQQQQTKANSLGGLLNGAALMSYKDDHSKPEDAAQNRHAPGGAPLRAVTQPDESVAWKKTGQAAEDSDQHESARVSTRFGYTLKKLDAKVRTAFGVNAPPTVQDMKSPYSVGNDDHLDRHDSHGVAEFLDEASLETLQHLTDDDDDDDDDDIHDVDLEDDGDDATAVGEQDHPDVDTATESLKQTQLDAEERRSGSLDDTRPGDSVRTTAPIKISADEKMKAILEEFGECPSLSNPDEPEKLVTDIAGVLVKTVLIKGSIFLTNRRICFLAYIPTTKAEQPEPIDGGASSPLDPSIVNPILKSGPAIIHRPGKMRPKRKVWIELRKDSFNAYTASNKLYKPLFSARLSNLSALLPIDWSHPTIIRFVEGDKYSAVEFKTQEAALDWRKELEAAAFHARNTSDRVRISIPFERILGIDTAAWMQVAKVIHIDILVGAIDEAAAAAAIAQQEKDLSERRHLLDKQGWSAGTHFVSCPKDPGFKCHISQIVLGFTHNRAAFIDVFRDALESSKQTLQSHGHKAIIDSVPAPLLDVQGEPDADDAASDSNELSDDHKRSLAEKFCHAFGLPSKPEELKLVKAELVRTLHTHGTLAIGLDYLLFWRRAVGRDLKVKVPLTDIQGVDTYRSLLWHHHGLVVHITAHPDMFFDFTSKDNRDMALSTLKRIIKATEQAKQQRIKDAENASLAATDDSLSTKVDGKKTASEALLHNAEGEAPVLDPEIIGLLPKVVNIDPDSMRKALRISPMRIYCLTIGSRGDVQPYIAFCKALKEHGHTPVIVSHPEYRDWVEGHGIEYRGVGGDPAALMKLSVEHRIFSPAFFRESIGKFRVWLDELLRECWEECQGADLLIESPSTMAGIHVAEGLGIPYFRAFTMPWTKTSAYPQAFSVPAIEMGPSYNSSSYVMFDQIMWVATSGQINRWRKHMIGIGPTDWSKLDAGSVPFIYNFSPAVVPMPNDWGDRVKISGYWFLDNPEANWSPPKELSDFLEKAKKDEKKVAYVGFGSITIENADEVSANIMKAVHQAGVRAIVAKGWSGRGGSKPKKKKRHCNLSHDPQHSHPESENNVTEDEEHEHIEIPDDVFVVDSIPHDWLFPQIDIAMHHGGAGTTGASLRAGLVTLIKPFFGDQFFWANRVQKLGAGARVNSLSVSDLTDVLKAAASDRVMVEKAQGVGEKIRTEDGVGTAIEFLYKNIPLAKRRTQRRLEREASTHSPSSPGGGVFSNPLSRFSSHRQNSSGSELSNKADHLRSATMPVSGREVSNISTSATPTTILESSADESEELVDSPATSPSDNSSSILPSLSSLSALPASMASSIKEVITLQSSTTDTTADGEEVKGKELTRSNTTPAGRQGVVEETEEQKMQRLKGYKNAKAEDIRRRKLLIERLAREKREKETKEAKEKLEAEAKTQAHETK